MLLLRDDLLTPIDGSNPSGAYLAFDGVDDTYARIQEARREDVAGSRDTSVKKADHTLVIKLASEALARRSKDLQIAAWLAEALTRRDGVGGLRAGLELLDALVERFWESVYPEPEEGDVELRTAPLGMAASALPIALRLAPLTLSPERYDLYKFGESRDVGYEKEIDDAVAKRAPGAEERRKRREEQLASGRLAPETFDAAVAQTPKTFYREMVVDLAASARALASLEARVEALAADAAPSFRVLHETLAQVTRAADALLQLKLRQEPDEPGEEPPNETSSPPPPLAEPPRLAVPDVAVPATAPVAATAAMSAIATPAGDDGAAHIVAGAHALRRARPHDPASYLVLRALRWGELRGAGGRPIDPSVLAAPPSDARVRLRTLLLAERWAELLEGAEEVMGTPAGRGWLDLQRHVMAACAGLGAEYDAVATALRGALRELLRDLPGLVHATLMDDTPAANGDTRAWLAAHVTRGDADESVGPSAQDDGVDPRASARAAAALRDGDGARAVAVLFDALTRERTARGRFLRRTEIAAALLDAGQPEVAAPVLRELLELIETHRLEGWERPEVVARPMLLLCRCLDASGAESDLRRTLYLRACRIDPPQALALPTPATP